MSRCRHRPWRDNSKTKALIGQVHDTARDPAGISLWKRSSAVPLGCHAEINKSALIGQVRDTARYPAGITPSVNGPLGEGRADPSDQLSLARRTDCRSVSHKKHDPSVAVIFMTVRVLTNQVLSFIHPTFCGINHGVFHVGSVSFMSFVNLGSY